jgi:hypothetical protein
MITTAQAVASLRPNVEWTMNGDDVENIIWHTANVEPLTTAEVNAEIKRLEKLESSKASAKSALLDRLGITAEEANLLLS